MLGLFLEGLSLDVLCESKLPLLEVSCITRYNVKFGIGDVLLGSVKYSSYTTQHEHLVLPSAAGKF